MQSDLCGRRIGDSLARSDLHPEPTQTLLTPIPNGNYKCGSCAQCNSTTKTSFFRHSHTGRKIPVSGIISCNTKGVIYLITCSCGKVGQTRRQLKQHITEHRSSIRCKNIDYPVAAHFVEANHPIFLSQDGVAVGRVFLSCHL